MDFGVTAEAPVGVVSDLIDELMDIAEPHIGERFNNVSARIILGIRHVSASWEFKSFQRYTIKDNTLVIDICTVYDDYEFKPVALQREMLGDVVLHWLDKGLNNKRLLENNPELDPEQVKEAFVKMGQKHNWFTKYKIGSDDV